MDKESRAPYFILSDDCKTLMDYTGDEETVVIGEGIEYIADNAFSSDKIDRIVLPESLDTFSNVNFYGCPNLREIVLPRKYVERAHDLSELEFNFHCPPITFIIPNGTETIGHSLFANCQSIKDVYIPSSVRTICEGAFAASGLEKCLIPKGVKYIHHNAFFNISNMVFIELPETLECIEKGFLPVCGLIRLNIKCNTPKTLIKDENNFEWGFNTQDCILYVPQNSVEQYSKFKPFTNFKEIKIL